MMANMMPDATTVQPAMASTPSAWIPSCSTPPPSNKPYLSLATYAWAMPSWEANRPTAMTPQTPLNACTDTAPTGSSILSRSSPSMPKMTTGAAIAPITIAAQGSTTAQGAVMATNPPSAPFSVRPMSKCGERPLDRKAQHTAPAPAARVVFTATFAASAANPPVRPSVEPGLNPYQPNQRMKTPSAARLMLWPGIGLMEPSLPYLPIRGPTMIAPIRPAKPPTMCTTPEPAKSR